MPQPKTCYGDLFPDLDRLEHNEPLRGRAFRALVESMGIGAAARRIEVDAEGWKRCGACECYRSCYDLSMAKLLLQLAVALRAY